MHHHAEDANIGLGREEGKHDCFDVRSPTWLIEFHRQWLAARGRELVVRSRPFSRDWNPLLDAAGLLRSEDVNTATREAEALEKEGRISLKRHRYRLHLIERVVLPLEAETWLRGLFSSASPESLLADSLAHVKAAAAASHPHNPTLWTEWCASITAAFSAGLNHHPLRWRSPESVREILRLVHGLTSREWRDVLIREASVALGMDSKGLERRQHLVEAALTSFFGQPTPLEAIGILPSDIRVELAGPLCLHFADGTSQQADHYRGIYHLTSDLARAVRVTTTASRVLTVENSKTTLRRLASLNENGETLLVGCSFPTRGVRRLLELLPADLPLAHFGDTDPAGFHILAKLRAAAGRPVNPWLMHRRTRPAPVPLTAYDRTLLPRLIADPWLEDVRPILLEIQGSGDKGDFEQETLGASAAGLDKP